MDPANRRRGVMRLLLLQLLVLLLLLLCITAGEKDAAAAAAAAADFGSGCVLERAEAVQQQENMAKTARAAVESATARATTGAAMP
jgi:hypothetical protein